MARSTTASKVFGACYFYYFADLHLSIYCLLGGNQLALYPCLFVPVPLNYVHHPQPCLDRSLLHIMVFCTSAPLNPPVVALSTTPVAAAQNKDPPVVRGLDGRVQEVGEYDERPRDHQSPVHICGKRQSPFFLAQHVGKGHHRRAWWACMLTLLRLLGYGWPRVGAFFDLRCHLCSLLPSSRQDAPLRTSPLGICWPCVVLAAGPDVP